MQGAGAPRRRGPYSGEMGALGRPGVILLTYALVTLGLTCLFMRFSIMPYLTRRLGLDSVAFGHLQTTFGALQLLGGPVLGRFADRRGARAAFTLTFLASSAFYLLLAAACSPALPGVALLYATPLPVAFMQGMPVAQMTIADLSEPQELPEALGRLGLCFGVGMIFGSLLGGTLSATCGPWSAPWEKRGTLNPGHRALDRPCQAWAGNVTSAAPPPFLLPLPSSPNTHSK
uniref:Solute carrier family 22 member 18 n=1 Tax=Lynx canadensis TaxID=61383 RepID=A0A667HJU0_LYNCA